MHFKQVRIETYLGDKRLSLDWGGRFWKWRCSSQFYYVFGVIGKFDWWSFLCVRWWIRGIFFIGLVAGVLFSTARRIRCRWRIGLMKFPVQRCSRECRLWIGILAHNCESDVLWVKPCRHTGNFMKPVDKKKKRWSAKSEANHRSAWILAQNCARHGTPSYQIIFCARW